MDINTKQFKGPFDLLLEMIEDQKLDITEVNLAQITDQYVERIEKEKDKMDPEEMADFLMIASKLLLIKSKTLLPYLIKEEEEEEISDFTSQLKIYKDFVEAARVIEDILSENKKLFAKEYSRQGFGSQVFFNPPQKINQKILYSSFKEIIARIKPQEKLQEEVIAKSVRLDERIAEIKSMLQKLKTMSFSKLFKQDTSKVDIIVNFLATLELIKRRQAGVKQKNLFGDIEIMQV